jgi:TetR/AcrR family transcriptional regulator
VRSSGRRFGAENSATRLALIEAGIKVLQNKGAAALTAKRVAEQAGLKPQLVHYYFRTIEDLIIAIVRFAGAEALKRTVRAAASDRPLLELWKECKHEGHAALAAEIKALAQHSEAVRAESIRLVEQHRMLMAEAIGRHLEKRGIQPRHPPMATAMILDAITRLLVGEKALGFTLGHELLEAEISKWLEGFYGMVPSQDEVDRSAA